MYCDDPAMLNNNLGKFSYTLDAEKAFGHPCTCTFQNHLKTIVFQKIMESILNYLKRLSF